MLKCQRTPQRAPSASARPSNQPVSNFGARPRLVIAWKGLQRDVAVASPSELGGLKSAEYLALNPQGKMPLLTGLPNGRALPESEVIVGYLLDVFAARGPSLRPPTPEGRAAAALLTRLHDTYLGPLQGAMYKEMDVMARVRDIGEIARQLRVLEDAMDAGGPYAAGPELSTADAALFPTFVFYTHMLPAKFGWRSVFTGKPRLERWWAALCAQPDAAAVRADMEAGLAKWEEAQRWDKVRTSALCVCVAGADGGACFGSWASPRRWRTRRTSGRTELTRRLGCREPAAARALLLGSDALCVCGTRTCTHPNGRQRKGGASVSVRLLASRVLPRSPQRPF